MKKFLLLCVYILISPVFAGEINFNDIPVNSTVYYSPDTETWSISGNGIKFVKTLTNGENRFSEYISSNLHYDPNSTREFFYNGSLIGYNKNNLKFHRILFKGGTIIEEKLNEREIAELFPDYEIIKISQFKDNKIKVFRQPFVKKKFILINDTNIMFYNYSFTNDDNSKSEFNCIFIPSRSGDFRFAPKEKSINYIPYIIQVRYKL